MTVYSVVLSGFASALLVGTTLALLAILFVIMFPKRGRSASDYKK